MQTNHRTRGQRGFSLIELLVVITIIGILAGIAMVNVKNWQRRARETALADNLTQMRKAIDNFHADKQRFPNDLNELVPNYLRRLPEDPVTEQVDWEEVRDNPSDLEQMGGSTDPEEFLTPGVIDVKSKAQGQTLDGKPYGEL